MPIRLALVNDYEVVVRGLAEMLRSYTDAFDIVELDADMPVQQVVDIALYDTFAQAQGDGEGVARLLANPRVDKLVVYSWNLQESLSASTMQRGVSGYLSKSLTASELTTALRQVARGETVISPDPAGSRAAVVGGDWPGREEGLTAREAEVLALITQGKRTSEVASALYIGVNSVKTHTQKVFRKIGVTTRTEAALWGVDHGFVPDHRRIDHWRGGP
jgi:DNA-binding NarL/FixJ family response regulator